MAKKLFKEEQKYHDYGVIALISFLSLALLWRIAAGMFETVQMQWSIIVPLVLVFGLVWLVILKMRMKIKISQKYLTLSLNPFMYPKVKLPWEEVKAISFFKLSEVALLSGQNVHFSSSEAHFGMGDKAGMQICTTDGREYTVFSSTLYRNRAQLMQRLQTAHPTVDFTGCGNE